MSGEQNLSKLLATMEPVLKQEHYVFCTLPDKNILDVAHLSPICTFQEDEGLTVILPKAQAEQASLSFSSVFCCITLSVHSSLEAVGLTAAVASALAEVGISANVVAAYYHDHIFVAAEDGQKAIASLQALADRS